jgi:hypothetical protein
MSIDAKVTTVTERYLAELLPAFSDDSKHSLPWTFFLDCGNARCRFVDLLSESMFPWHVQTSRLNERIRKRIGRSPIRRVNPVVQQDYSPDDLKLLKYNLHFQLALGIEVYLLVVGSSSAAEAYFGVDNFAIVARRELITDHHPYDPAVPSELRVEPWTNSSVRDFYTEIEDIGHRYQLVKLHYNDSAFTCSRRDLKSTYGDLLYVLQNGRCALSGEPLAGDWHVDHIVPIEKGGNNTLINLQAANARANIIKGAAITDSAYCFSTPALAAIGLNATYHRRLTDRRLVGVHVGLSAAFELQAWLN